MKNMIGINAHIPTNEIIDQVATAGINWIRVDFDWPDIEPTKGKFHFAEMDRVTREAQRRGINVFGTLAYCPSWANDGDGFNIPPDNPSDWYNFVYKTVKRYKNTVTHWGIWNEPNGMYFLASSESYLNNILLPAIQAIRIGASDCKIVAPDVICFGNWKEWLDTVFSNEIVRKEVDIFSCHVYKESEADGGKAVVELLEKGERVLSFYPKWHKKNSSVKDVMKKLDIEYKPLWLTETGWHTLPSENKYAVSQNVQSNRIKDVLTAMLYPPRASWWHRTFIYEMRDIPHSAKTQGIIDAYGTPKIAYEMIQNLPDDI